MNIFVSGKFEDRKAIQYLQQELIKLGHTISEDWTYHEYTDKGYPVDYAVDDIEGIKHCDVYVGRFVADYNYKGALVELGATLSLNKKCYIIGHAIDSCIFINHPLVRTFDDDNQFLRYWRYGG